MASEPLLAEDRRLQDEIDSLRERCSDTQELYREVCVLLFFRHGITPTANKLYQLVRKGSMSAPAEALSKFWVTLREKSRVRIEHPDLPDELRDVAGEAIGALWQRAQTLADAHLATMRNEAQAAVIEANAAAERAQQQASATLETLSTQSAQLAAAEHRAQQLEQELAREQGQRSALERQVLEASSQHRDLQRALEEARLGFERQLVEQRDLAKAAEQRHQADLNRVLLDVDRERSASAKLLKDLDLTRRQVADQTDHHRAQLRKQEDELIAVRHKLSGAEAALAEARSTGDQLRRHLDHALVKPARKKAVAKKS